jgi:predicted ArsR family transcriptional regulator
MDHPNAVDFWTTIDADVLRCLAARDGEMTPAQIARSLGMSEQAVRSILGMLAEAGKVRVTSVERIVSEPRRPAR